MLAYNLWNRDFGASILIEMRFLKLNFKKKLILVYNIKNK